MLNLVIKVKKLWKIRAFLMNKDMLSIFITQISKVKVVEGYVYFHGRITHGLNLLKGDKI